MSRDYRLYLDDIVEGIQRIREYTVDMDKAGFMADRKTQDAVVRNLEVIGEAAGRLPDEIRQHAAEIEWRKMAALRNILAHEYFGIHLPILWDVIHTKLDSLESACRKLLAKRSEEW
jgi:uncharacterized protein with HEPN domain